MRCAYLFLLVASFAFVHANVDSFLILRGASDHSISSMSEQNVIDLVSHVNGLAPVHQINRDQFPRTNLFSSPAANVFIAFDAVTPEMLNKENARFLNIENEQTVEVVKSNYPEDSLSTLTTLLTGEDYTTHGINGHSWKASRDVSVEAYSQNGNCQSPKFADRMAATSEGSARVISVSGSKKMAAAMGVNSELVKQNPEWNCETLYFSRKQGLVELYSDETILNFGNIATEANKRFMTLKTLEGHILATEISAIASIPSRLLAMNQKSDATDFIAIGITSVKALTLKYGADSPQVTEALRLLDIELEKLFVELEKIYNGEIVTEIVGLGSSTSEHTFYTQSKQQMKLVQADDEPVDGSTDTYSVDDVRAFQTTFWVAIVLIIAFAISSITLVKMDMLENSLIYRSTDGPRPIPDVQ